jgi:hypothetical protein
MQTRARVASTLLLAAVAAAAASTSASWSMRGAAAASGLKPSPQLHAKHKKAQLP